MISISVKTGSQLQAYSWGPL